MTVGPRLIESVVPTVSDGLQQQGWCLIDWPSDKSLLTVARELGTPVPSRSGGSLVDELRPVRPQRASARSLSAIWGLGSFPFHTDGSAHRIPPRYVLLRLAPGAESQRPTLLQDFEALALPSATRRSLARDVWLVNGGRGRFLTSILNSTAVKGESVLRFDMACMRPRSASPEAARALQRACASKPTRVDWESETVLVLDNWRVLHARGGATSATDDAVRVLERVSVGA